MDKRERKPAWLKPPQGKGEITDEVRRALARGGLHTVCRSAHCPNLGECWSRGTATIMILGDVCTRNCRFCAVADGVPAAPAPDEPDRVARAIRELGLSYVVLTSVTRDDLDDGGAGHWARVIAIVGQVATVEALVPDFGGDVAALDVVFAAKPAVLAHNLETVPSLYERVRPQADYERSLALLARAAEAGLIAKTGLMLGLGETAEEIRAVLQDARRAGVTLVTLGQYLRPTRAHLPVERWISPGEFARWKREGEEMGFRHVESGPLVRSSYRAADGYNEALTGMEAGATLTAKG